MAQTAYRSLCLDAQATRFRLRKNLLFSERERERAAFERPVEPFRAGLETKPMTLPTFAPLNLKQRKSWTPPNRIQLFNGPTFGAERKR